MKLPKSLTYTMAALSAVLLVGSAQVSAQTSPANDKIPGQYIVVLRDGVSASAVQDILRNNGVSASHQYGAAVKGFAAGLSESKVQALKQDPRVAYVAEDRLVNISGKGGNGSGSNKPPQTSPPQTVPTGVKRIGAATTSNHGTGVGVAVIDTGVDLKHSDLKDNLAAYSTTCVSGTRSANDDNGHGTHVAGTIAAVDNTTGVVGVAPGAKIFPVKVLNRNGSGTWSGVICGIDWVTAHAAQYGISVASMSLSGGGTSDNNCGLSNNDPLHQAICNSTAAGVTYVVAAGNSAANASNETPAAYNDTVITVSALADSDGLAGGLGAPTSYGADDTFATFSNFGSVVDIAAPGVDIYSTWKGGAYATISGTSMATPHVSGAAALYIKSHPGSTWQQVRDGLLANAEAAGAGHTDPSGLHPEPVVLVNGL